MALHEILVLRRICPLHAHIPYIHVHIGTMLTQCLICGRHHLRMQSQPGVLPFRGPEFQGFSLGSFTGESSLCSLIFPPCVPIVRNGTRQTLKMAKAKDTQIVAVYG